MIHTPTQEQALKQEKLLVRSIVCNVLVIESSTFPGQDVVHSKRHDQVHCQRTTRGVQSNDESSQFKNQNFEMGWLQLS